MRTRSLAPLLLVLLGLHLATPAGRAADDLAVFGVRPGMTAAQVEKSLGRPQVERHKPPTWLYRREHQGVRGQDDPAVYFNSDRRVVFVTGSRLDSAGTAALRRGASAAELEALLGAPSSVHPGHGGTVLYVYRSRQLTAVLTGKPARVLVFGLGQEPGR